MYVQYFLLDYCKYTKTVPKMVGTRVQLSDNCGFLTTGPNFIALSRIFAKQTAGNQSPIIYITLHSILAGNLLLLSTCVSLPIF